jgi:GntR family transcriptional regulator/MocR family aminotransferase
MLRPWVPNIIVRAEGRGSLSLRIAQAIIEEIQRGRLAAGDSLPGTRDLARDLSVNRKTVVQAYEELNAQGWVTTDERRGTFVARSIGETPARSPDPEPAKAIAGPRGREVRPPLLWPPQGKVRFDDGAPDPRLIPATAIAQAYASGARAAARQRLLCYGDPRGTEALRQSISKMLNMTRGLNTTPDNICVTRGSQMALYVIAQCLVARDDTVIFEELTYPPAVQAFALAGARIASARLTPEGIDLDHLEDICRHTRVRAIYLTPGHQFPTTVVLRPSARLRLRALAAQFGFVVIEDDYDHEFQFEHQPMFPLASNDTSGQIVYVGSFSKILSPSLRIGYVVGPTRIIEQIGNWIGTIDRQGDPITELAIVELIESGQLRRHIKRVHAIFDKRRETFAETLRAELGGHASFEMPTGGLAFWVRFPDSFDLEKLERQPGSPQFLTSIQCAIGGRPKPAARLGFASLDAHEMATTVAALKSALKEAQNRAVTPSLRTEANANKPPNPAPKAKVVASGRKDDAVRE